MDQVAQRYEEGESSRPGKRKIAFVLNGSIDDWLDSLGFTIEEFCESMMGSWVFGYADALKSIGVESVIIAMASVSSPTRCIHASTGSTIWLLPLPRVARWVLSTVEKISAVLLPDRMARRVLNELHDIMDTPVSMLSRIILDEQCDAVIVQDFETTRFDLCTLIGHRNGLPVFGTFTGRFPQRGLHRLVRKCSMRAAQGLVICSSTVLDRVQADYGLPESKLLKLYYPVDRNVWFPENQSAARLRIGLPDDAVIAVYHGNIDMQTKGIDILLSAWKAAVQQDRPESAQLIIIGNGPDGDRLHSALLESGRNDIIFVRNWIHDRGTLRHYLSASDFYVFPSRFEPFGIAALEAMACGLPVLTTRTCSTLDIFPDLENSGAIVVEPDNVNAFANGLRRMLGDPSTRLKIAECARERVASPDFDLSIARRLADFQFHTRSAA